MNIRELENWGAVRKIWVKGSRKDFYEAELDVKKVVANKLKGSVQKRLAEITNMMEQFNAIVQSASAELTEEEKGIARVYEERIKKIEDLKTLASTALTIAEKSL